MFNPSHNNYIAIINVSVKYIYLDPLSKDYPPTNLPIGNKKIILYLLQQLQSISISKIFVIYNQPNAKVKQYIQKEFLPQFPHYPHTIEFFKIHQQNLSQYLSLQQLFQSQQFEMQTSDENFKGTILMPVDTISSFKVKDIVDEHIEKKSDLALLLKQKKQYSQGQKKPQIEFQNEYDIGLIGSNNQVLYLQSVDEFQYSGFKLNPSIYHRSSQASFKKLIDSQIYILGRPVIKMVKSMKNSQLFYVKNDFINCAIKNQTNTTLLHQVHPTYSTALKIHAKIAGPDEYIRRITQCKIYWQINLDSLITGPKKKQILSQTEFTQPVDQKYMQQYKGTLIGTNCLIDPTCKVKRSCVEHGCKIGKNVEIFNSIILSNAVIEQGCKITDSVIGPNCIVRQECYLTECFAAAGCHIEGGRKLEKEQFIPNQ